MSWKKRLVFSVILFAIGIMTVLAGVELFCQIFSASFANFRQTNIEHILDQSEPVYGNLTWAHDLMPHPYVGYLRSSQHQLLERLAIQDKGCEYRILILGGSVAENWSKYIRNSKMHLERLQNQIPIGHCGLKVLSLAVGGHKQPQQFHLSAMLLEKVDLIINLDGLNEALVNPESSYYPLEYPRLVTKFFTAPSIDSWLSLAQSEFTDMFTNFIDSTRSSPLMQKSFVVSGVYWSLRNLSSQLLTWRNESYWRKIKKTIPKHNRSSDFMNINPERIEIWAKYSRLEYGLDRKSKNKIHIFLQPNQYLQNSKTLSDFERDSAFSEANLASYSEAMEMLRKKSQQLNREGVPIYDLTQIFKDTPETIYVDVCCHINAKGNELISDRIIDQLIVRKAFK